MNAIPSEPLAPGARLVVRNSAAGGVWPLYATPGPHRGLSDESRKANGVDSMERDYLARSMASAVKAQVDHVEEQLAKLFPDQYVRHQADPVVPAEVLALVNEGKRTEAIKLYRSRTGVSLDEAREVVDGL